MKKATRVIPLNDYVLQVEFQDGLIGTVDLKDRLFGPVFEPLKDVSAFKQVGIDDFGAVCWPCDADLAPDGLYEKISKQMQPA